MSTVWLASAIPVLAGCAATAEDPPLSAGPGQDAQTAEAFDAGLPSFDAAVFDATVILPPPQPSADCSAGQYDGMFQCLIAGLLPWEGKMSFSLVQKTSGAGEFLTLEIIPGTEIIGNDDSLQGMFAAQLTGTFDCRTGVLGGRLEDGNYVFAGFMNYQLEGDLTGNYAVDAGVPEFHGSMGPLSSKNFDFGGANLGPMAMCTWDAARTGDARTDAGVPNDAATDAGAPDAAFGDASADSGP